MSDCLFCSIASGDIPADVVYRDESMVAFRDIAPQAPTHILVIPQVHYPNAHALAEQDPALVGRLLELAGQLAAEEGLVDQGYRIVTNTGEMAGQSVPHVHFHVLGGRALAWPPG